MFMDERDPYDDAVTNVDGDTNGESQDDLWKDWTSSHDRVGAIPGRELFPQHFKFVPHISLMVLLHGRR